MDATNHHSSVNIDVQYSLYKSGTITTTAMSEWRKTCCRT